MKVFFRNAAEELPFSLSVADPARVVHVCRKRPSRAVFASSITSDEIAERVPGYGDVRAQGEEALDFSGNGVLVKRSRWLLQNGADRGRETLYGVLYSSTTFVPERLSIRSINRLISLLGSMSLSKRSSSFLSAS